MRARRRSLCPPRANVLFAPGSAELNPRAARDIARVAALIRDIGSQVPEGIDWVMRVDGHTDNTPLGLSSPFASNWELSQARALAVVERVLAGDLRPGFATPAGVYGADFVLSLENVSRDDLDP